MGEISDERLAEMIAGLEGPIGAAVLRGQDLSDMEIAFRELQRRRAEARQEPGEDWTCPICGGGPGNNCACSCTPAYRPEPLPAGTVTEEIVEAVVEAVRPYTRETLFIDEHRALVRAALEAAFAARPAEPVAVKIKQDSQSDDGGIE